MASVHVRGWHAFILVKVHIRPAACQAIHLFDPHGAVMNRTPNTNDDQNEGNDGAGDDDNGGAADKSADTKKKDNGSLTIIVVVVAIFVIIIGGIITVVVIIKRNSGALGDRNVVSFENPMYDTAGRPKQTPAAGQQGGGYQDVQPNAGYTQDGTYAEPFDDGQATNSGYMDLSPTAAGGGGNTGYVDVAPNQVSLGGNNDDGEDV